MRNQRNTDPDYMSKMRKRHNAAVAYARASYNKKSDTDPAYIKAKREKDIAYTPEPEYMTKMRKGSYPSGNRKLI